MFKKKLILNPESSLDSKTYKKNAEADSTHCYSTIFPYLNKNKKILEVGGGIHLLTDYLDSLGYDISSVEPGGFRDCINDLKNQITYRPNLKIYKTTLEQFSSKEKFDFIFSMNVLEHVDNIEKHILCCIKFLKDENSLLFIQCPNYTFPFEPHFYKWFIPFFPKFTFTYLRKKNLIKTLGEKRYSETLKNLNFNCSYFKIKKLNLSIKFINPWGDIFDRLDYDPIFRKRLLANSTVKLFYKLIKFFKIQKILNCIYPVAFAPYLLMQVKKYKKS
jgi:2-polyprenyl-3-methyl-5-hydroxy-6-metoxy-1,4-benzoquinol methylase